MKLRAGSLISAAFLLFLQPMAAQVGGTGTTNHVPLWTNSSTLGNSVLFQSGGNVGVGNTAPLAILGCEGEAGNKRDQRWKCPDGFESSRGLRGPFRHSQRGWGSHPGHLWHRGDFHSSRGS